MKRCSLRPRCHLLLLLLRRVLKWWLPRRNRMVPPLMLARNRAANLRSSRTSTCPRYRSRTLSVLISARSPNPKCPSCAVRTCPSLSDRKCPNSSRRSQTLAKCPRRSS
uniref:Putative secreted protein n=1 Tax=Anopheles darlingi TaxID=43151 RepID=A0A2M4D6B1_ANODA